MNRTEKITGACMALLAAAAIGQFYLDKETVPQPASARQEPQAQSAPETRVVTADETVSAGLSGFQEKDAAGRLVAVGAVVEELESASYASAKLSPESGAALVSAGTALLGEPGGPAQDESGVAGRLTGIIARRTRGEASRDFIVKVITDGPEGLREAALKGVGRGGVGGKAVFEAVSALAKKGGTPFEPLAGALRRTGGKKSGEILVELMRSTDDWKAIGAFAVAIQDLQDPVHIGAVLERLEQTGLIDAPKKMPYISGTLLSKHLEKAEGSALTRGIKVLRTRPGLVASNASAVSRGLDSSDAETRRWSAVAVREAVEGKTLDPLKAQELLAGRLDRETEPVLKAELTGSIDLVRRVLDGAPEPAKAQ